MKVRKQLKRKIQGGWKRKDGIFVEIRKEVQKKMSTEPEFSAIIGKLREDKVAKALQSLKEKGEIHDYLKSGKLSYLDLIEGVDFIFIYIDGCYKVCRFSVTGWRWLEEHQKNILKFQHCQLP